ncbi:MAG: SUMF1/EgtB/PvdO family nonheme iron enzyme [Proteobacteria bacterium]|nr:hypothetical protein [Pseudomonadota bacterium]NOG59975.1 SUMF1/EgtB/PvdO family nonheme iron enzyme [Pseudomonadota bacterium]
MDSSRNALASGYKLHWYTIKKILGQGGFGITYLAEDTNLNQLVAIKEFLPIEMAVRDQSSSVHPVSGDYGEQFEWGLDRFMSEAQTLAKFKHPNIVRVFTVFPENNTAYMVMEYEHGKGMDELLKNKKTLSEDQLKAIINPILDGLKLVHENGFIHRDIKPANIFIREDGSPVLLDFGSARQSFGQQTRTLTTMVSPGFAPFEQYVSKSDKQGPWTDIYGLGATMYRAIIGRSPAEAMERSEGLLHNDFDALITTTDMKPEGYSSSLLSAIDHALAFKPENRPQSISEWQAEINGTAYAGQSEVETVVATDHVSQSTVAATEKTEVLEHKYDDKQDRKKPSLFKRIVKYGLIGFGILFVLAILSEDEQQKEQDAEQITESLAEEKIIEEQTPVPQEFVAETEIEDTKDEQIRDLLARADKDIQALRLTKPPGNNALEKYHQVLNMDQGNADAEAGLTNVATEYLKLVEQNLQNKEMSKALQYLNLAKRVSPDHPDIPTIEKILKEDIAADKVDSSDVEQTQQKEVEASLFSTEDKKQIGILQSRLRQNPRDRDARKELQSIMKSYEDKVKEAINNGELDQASAYIREALEIAPRSDRLKLILKKIEKKKNQQDTRAGKIFRDELENGGKGPEMVVIPAGSFLMGSKRRAREFFTGEYPIHKVKIEKPFAMSIKEITVSEFSDFIEATEYQTEAEWQGGCGYWDKEWKVDPERNWRNPGFQQSDNNPVVCISWNDANAAARWLSKQTGHNYRLPSEAEWEYAARAGKKGENYWGSVYDEKCQYENLMDYDEKNNKTFFQCTDGYTYTAPAANFNANAFGLYDVLGNVLELTLDCFNENYKGVNRNGHAVTTGDCNHRMVRGGAWALPRGQSDNTPTLTSRVPWVQNNRGYMIGFRLMREL